ncbi:hypothetical protein KAH43_07955 [Candidatus Bipolaricaulota bacterium]|nr:hypothetical protein [Candidatus Bipolaricaulota bacterium]
MKTIQLLLAIAVLCTAAAHADSMDAQGTASGNAVLYFSGPNVTGTFDSTFVLTGHLNLDERVIAFSASGWARGSGSGDTATLDIDAQATFAAMGITETGENISVQGGLTLTDLTADQTGSSGSGMGAFIATIFLGDRIYRVQGGAEGSASGALVIPEDPYSMELAGGGIFDLSGKLTPVSPAADLAEDGDAPANASIIEILPWDTLTWSEELLAELLDILTHVIAAPAAETAPPTDE